MLLAIVVLITANSCKVGRFIVYNFADINDHKKFPAIHPFCQSYSDVYV